ncbi:sugar kinase [Allosediminivita pacifica]|uniref:Putative NBD/HSP70 family sugar kinase n=1 Tax=Allosediminivita pacifica TaxID=1267769 RepID=A0A2T6B5C8_9RHOB|nr:putative NBD/HSP70 family sugar kinase [Allosediminivita pacifica]GGA98418.1 sugar kinase [Allosediminivita pacifica]
MAAGSDSGPSITGKVSSVTRTVAPTDSTHRSPRGALALGKNPGRSRSHNRRVLLELLRRNGPQGRKALADLAGISTQAVANIIEELVADGLLLDMGRKRTGRGLPPIQYAINPDGAVTIGLEISVGELTATLLDLGGNLRHEERFSLDDMRPDAVLALIGDEVRRLIARQSARLMGVGVVMPGPFGIEGLSGVGPTTLKDWTDIDVAGRLSGDLGVPVVVDNDANAAAVGEMLFGKGQNVGHFCMLYFGAGIGLGAIVQDQPLRGAFGNAGEIGHIPVAPGGLPCQCGQSGCLEGYASIHALSGYLGSSDRVLRADEIRARIDAGDPAIDDWLASAAPHLATMIGMIENIFDPQTVILGGKLPGRLLDDLVARLKVPPSVANRPSRVLPRVQRGQAGQGSAALGAAALPFFNAITPQLDLAEPVPVPQE